MNTIYTAMLYFYSYLATLNFHFSNEVSGIRDGIRSARGKH